MSRAAWFLVVLAAGIVVAAVVGRSAHAGDAPYRPAKAADVIEQLPSKRGDPEERKLDAMRRELATNPRNVALAVRLARLDIETGRARSDPRFLGYAQAALGPWWNEPAPPTDVLVLRATIRQSTHDFPAALADLDRALEQAPDDAQAWLTRSVVLAVRGDYAAARASCEPLPRLTTPLVVAVCTRSIDSLTGGAKPALAALESALDATPRKTPGEEAWAASTLGEIAVRAGDDAAGERYFRRSLAIEKTDGYVLGALADLLLDRGRPAEAAELVRDQPQNDALLLRLAIAETRAKLAGAPVHVDALAARFDASRARGDTVHRREEARFALELAHDPPRALTLARANWNVQREPADARIFLESALAAHDPGAASAVIAALAASRYEEPRVTALAAQAAQATNAGEPR